MARRPHLRRRILGWALASLILLLGAGAAASQTAWFRDWLRREIVARTAGAFHGRLAIGTLEGDLLSRVALRDVALTLDGRPVLTIDRAEATYDVWSMLLGGGLRLATLTADGVDLRLVERDATWNLARALASPEPTEPSTTRFAIDALAVHGLHARVVRPGERWAVRDAHLTGRLVTGPDETTLTLTDAALRLVRRHLHVRELAGTVTIAADGRVAVDGLRLRTVASEIAGNLAFAPHGSVAVGLDATLAADEIHRLLDIDLPRADLQARIAAHGPTNAVAVDAAVHAGDAALTVGGTLDLAAAQPGYDLTIGTEKLDLAALFGPDRPTTDLHGSLHATGSGMALDAMDARVAVALHDSTIAGKPLAALDVDATVAHGTVRFTGRARSDAGSLRAEGMLTPASEQYDVTLTADRFDPATLLGDPALAGSVAGTLRATGTGFTPATAAATASLTLAPSRIGGVALQTARADVTARGGRLTIDRLVAAGPALALNANGELALAGSPAATSGKLAFDATARDVQALARLAGVTDAAGVVALRGTASGSLDALGLDATITGRDLAYGANRVGRLNATVGATALGSARGRARTQGTAELVTVGSQRLARATVEASWQQTGATTSTAHVAFDARDERDRRDVVVADATIEPAATRVQVGTLVVTVGADTWTAVGQPTVVVRAGGVTTDGVLLHAGDASIRIAGAARANGPSDLRIEIDRVELATIQTLTGTTSPRDQERVTGVLAGAATLSGTLAAPQITADARLAHLTIAGVRYASASAHVEATATRASTSARLEQTAGRALTLDAASPVDLSLSPFRFRATGDLGGRLAADRIDLAFVGALTSAVAEVRGVLAADVAIGGSVDQPTFRGPVTISGGHARVLASGITYDAIEVALGLEGRAASVERLHLAAGTGTLDGGGDVRLGPSGPELDVRIELARFPLFDNADGRGTASGWIWASGPLGAPVVEGSLETDRLVLQVPERLPGDVRPPDPTIEVVGPDAPAPPTEPAGAGAENGAADAGATPGILDRAAITVQLQVPRNAWIRRSDAEIELRGWMTAWKKPGDELQLSGRIEVVRGWFAFQGKTFDVTEGEALFTGAGLNPILRVVAQQRVGDYLARIILGGTLEQPTLTLESEPSLPQADVLSLLIFGKPASELSSGESVGLREQALGVAAGYAASELRQSVANALGVDTLEFSGGSDLSQAEVSAGKYVASDVFVSLAHRFGEAVQELRIQYFLTPRWTLETSTDTLGRSAVDVFWRRRY